MTNYVSIPPLNVIGLEELIAKNDYRLTHVEVLAMARKLIESGRENYICYAIHHVLCENTIDASLEQHKMLIGWIGSMLGVGVSSYASWFCKANVSFPWENFDDRMYRYGRLLWIDFMIKALS